MCMWKLKSTYVQTHMYTHTHTEKLIERVSLIPTLQQHPNRTSTGAEASADWWIIVTGRRKPIKFESRWRYLNLSKCLFFTRSTLSAQPVFGVSVGVVWSLATHNGIHMELDTCTHAGKVMAHVVCWLKRTIATTTSTITTSIANNSKRASLIDIEMSRRRACG